MTANKFDVDALAQEIRRVDGDHSLGAGALAEALAPYIAALQSQQGASADRGEAVGTLTVERFRGCDSMVNTSFDYIGDLPDGSYSLYLHPPSPAESAEGFWRDRYERTAYQLYRARGHDSIPARECAQADLASRLHERDASRSLAMDSAKLRELLALLDEAKILIEAGEPTAAGYFQRKFKADAADYLRDHGALLDELDALRALRARVEAAPVAIVQRNRGYMKDCNHYAPAPEALDGQRVRLLAVDAGEVAGG